MEYLWVGLAFFLVTMLGTGLQSATGFGMAIVCMAILPFFFPFNFVSVSVLLLGAYSAAQLFWRLRKDIDWRLVTVPLLFTLIFRFFGVGLIKVANPLAIKGFLGGVLILLAVYLVFFNQKFHFKANFWTGAVAGSVSGLLGGMFNISGPPMAAYMFNATEDRRKYAACLQMTFAIGGCANIVYRALGGQLVTGTNPWLLALALAAGVAGSLIGGAIGYRIFTRLNRKALTASVYGVMALSGVVNILQAFQVL